MKKYNFILITSVCVLVLLTIYTASNYAENNDQPFSQGGNSPKDILRLSDSEQDNSTWGYDEWRNFTIYKKTNMTESELDPAITSDPIFQHNLNIATIGIWGFNNGTFTEDDLIELSNQIIHNSVSIHVSSYVETSDERLFFYFNVHIQSNIILSYNVYSLSVSYKSTDPSGKWYSSSYQEIASIVAVLIDLDFFDDLPSIFPFSSDLLTGSLENDLKVKLTAICSQQIGIWGLPIPFWVDKFLTVDLTDDDTSGPVITTQYHGASTDAYPGYFQATATDPEGVVWQSSTTYYLRRTLGYQYATFIARDNDNDRPFDYTFSSKTVSEFIVDDDTTGPEITINYYGSANDGDSGYWEVLASDAESGIHLIEAWIDDELTTPVDGKYAVPNKLGEHFFRVKAYNADLDRGTIDREITELETSILIIDDDILAPEIIDCQYNSVVYDNEESIEIRVMALDELSGISEILWCNGISYSATLINEYYIFYIPNPRIPGFYTAEIRVFDNDIDRAGDQLYDSTIISFNVIDDDSSSPTIVFSYTGDYTDENPGSLIVSAFDDSGLSVNPSTIITLPADLGIYEYSFTAIDNDNDREGDSLSTIKTITITIDDDDITPPEIDINYIGSGTDSDPGYWSVTAVDLESDIASMMVLIDGVVVSIEIDEKYYIENTLGEHTISVTAFNADLDRGAEDQESSSDSASVSIIDDDTTPPQISNLIILDMIDYVAISFDAIDDYSGISMICITIDGIRVNSYKPLETETHFEFMIFNSWAMEIGDHNVLIEVWDADDDREGDALYTAELGIFTITFEDMKEFVIWEIDQLMLAIQESPDEQWGDPADQRKNAMLNKLTELKVLVISLDFEGAYDKVLHDIKPKLTGLKVDENGNKFGNGIFKNAWVIGDDYVNFCDQILANLQILINIY